MKATLSPKSPGLVSPAIYAPIHITFVDLLLHISEVCCWWKKMSANGKPAHIRTRILTDCARKRNRKEVLSTYKIRIYIHVGHQHDCITLDGNEESVESSNSC